VRLDAELADQVLPTFRPGQYDQAVLAAFRLVEDRVRHASRVAGGEVRVRLMRMSLGLGKPLADPNLLPGERGARADLRRLRVLERLDRPSANERCPV
jgi:hypothetical protein